jgi:lipopolysaccharide transport system permease protein
MQDHNLTVAGVSETRPLLHDGSVRSSTRSMSGRAAALLLKSLWQYRSLVLELVRREFSGKYRGSFGGLAWSFIQPLFLLAVYTVAFGVILKARWSMSNDSVSTANYALMLFAGLIVFNAFAYVLEKSVTLVTRSPNFVKKVVFPLELLPVVCVLTALAHALIGIIIWFLGYFVLFGLPKPGVVFFPLVLLSFLPLLLGVGWFLSALGVVARDIDQVTGMVNHTLLFLTPIFYSNDAAPPPLQKLLMFNPLTFVVEQFRLVIFYGQRPDFLMLAAYFILTSLFAFAGLALFRRLRPGFADLV